MQTNETYTRFADGYFQITIKAMNAKDKHDTTVIKVKYTYILNIFFYISILYDRTILISGGYFDN